MKKFLLIMITVLTVISLVACSASGISEEEAEKRTQAKLDEAADTYGEFLKYRLFLEEKLWKTVLQQSGITTEPATITTINDTAMKKYVKYLFTTEENEVECTSTSFVEGTVSGTTEAANAEVKISNVKMKATYKVTKRSDDSVVKDATDEEIVISEGSYKSTSTSSESITTQTTSITATINGTEYSISYTNKVEGGHSEYTAASVNGKQVDVKYINANNTYGNDEWY